MHEIQHHPHPHPSSNSFFTFPNNSSRSSEILDRLRGEYLEITSDFNSNNPISSPNRRNWKSSEEEREESYHILSTLRSMNLQAELLYNQQYSHHINLQIELNALKSQINLHSSGTTSSIDDSSGNNTIPPPPAPAFPMEERPTRSK